MNVREELKAYYDNELSPAQAEEVRRALESDPSALQELDEISRLSQILRNETVLPQPVGLEETLEALTLKRRKLSPVAQRARNWGRILLVGAAVTIVAALLFPTFSQAKMSAKNGGVDMVSMSKAVAGSAPSLADTATADGEQKSIMPAPMLNRTKDMRSRETPQSPNPRFKGYDGAAATERLTSPATTQLIVKTANLQVETPDVDAAQSKLEGLVSSVHGMVESSNRVDTGGPAMVTMTLRVPVWSFETCLTSIRKLGKVLSDNVGGQDVTGEVVDTEARLKVMRSEEEQYRMLLGKARSIGEVMQVRDRLSEVRQEIESLDAQRQSLRGMARMSTISVNLQQKTRQLIVQPVQPKTWSQNAWDGASDGLRGLGQFFGSVGIYLLVFSPLWLPLGLIGYMLYRRR